MNRLYSRIVFFVMGRRSISTSNICSTVLPKAIATCCAESKETVSPRKIRSMVSSRMVQFFAILGQDTVLNSLDSGFKTARL
mgnify:FL=1